MLINEWTVASTAEVTAATWLALGCPPGKGICLVVADLHTLISTAASSTPETGELLRELTLDPDRDGKLVSAERSWGRG